MRHLGGTLHCLEAAGPAPPLITGSFGPLDLYESLLGELDDQVVSGSLNELEVRIGSDSSSLASNIDVVKLALNGAKFAGAKVPPTIYSQLEGLKSSAGGTAPNSLWKDIEPFFKLRDEITKLIDPQTFVGKILGSLSASMDKLLYGAILPIRRSQRTIFDCILKIPAGKLQLQPRTARLAPLSHAGTTRNSTPTPYSIAFSKHSTIPSTQHPPPTSKRECPSVESWWTSKTPTQKTQLLLLYKDTIATNKNRLLLTKPGDYMNIRGFGDGPKSKTQSLTNVCAAGTIEMSDQAFSAAMEEIEAPPTC
ncbi:hypothetical protein OEA41_002725 [Lepraria neglecta]|uniref:Uncharacterized protein n=1 Tax=Lepraria neglecta TaxID=209136 RepID=A0AAD9Z3A4_9LECA|nr:hypothetical protein OEA41_002725 [Lepraria neglecta]